MALAAASGIISRSGETFATALANVTAFQSWVGAADAAAALTHIHPNDLPPPQAGTIYTRDELQALRPFAVYWHLGLEKNLISVDTRNRFWPEGRIGIHFEADVSSAHEFNKAQIARLFENAIGDIIDGLCALSAQDGYFDFHGLSYEPFDRSTEEERETLGDCVFCVCEVGWGLQG